MTQLVVDEIDTMPTKEGLYTFNGGRFNKQLTSLASTRVYIGIGVCIWIDMFVFDVC